MTHLPVPPPHPFPTARASSRPSVSSPRKLSTSPVAKCSWTVRMAFSVDRWGCVNLVRPASRPALGTWSKQDATCSLLDHPMVSKRVCCRKDDLSNYLSRHSVWNWHLPGFSEGCGPGLSRVACVGWAMMYLMYCNVLLIYIVLYSFCCCRLCFCKIAK